MRHGGNLHRLSLLSAAVLLPLVFWTPFMDCFPLPKILALALFGGLALVSGPWRISPSLVWVLPWAAWTVGTAFLGRGVITWWRSLPDALVLVLPVFLTIPISSAGPAIIRKLESGIVAVASVIGGYGLIQAFGLDLGSWISPFYKGVGSTIGNPDLLGGMLVFPFALALAGWLAGRSALRGVAVALIGAVIIATEARAAWLAAAVVMLVLAGRQDRKALGAVALAGIIFTAGWILTHPGARSALASRSAMEERLWTWKVSARSILVHPVTGWGAGSFRTVYLREQAEALKAGGNFHYTEFAHFEPVHLWTETGAVGLGLFLWGLACLYRAWRSSPGRPRVGAGWAGLLANASLSFPLHVPPTAVPAWVMAGSVAGGGFPHKKISWWLRAGMVIIFLAGLAVMFRFAPASGYLRNGQALAQDGRFLEAQECYSRSAALVPGDIRPWWYSAIAARLGYTPSRALEMADRGLQLEPAWAELHLERGMALKALGRLPEAERAYRESVRCSPGFSHAWNNLGNLLGSLGRLAEAEAAQRRALELAPDSPEARRNLAVTLVRMGRKKEAQAVLETQ